VEQIGSVQTGGAISPPFLIDQQRKRDSGVFAKDARVVSISQPHRRQVGATLIEFRLVFTQLRDVLAAENSTIVPKKNDDCGPLFPQRTKADFMPVCVRQSDVRQGFTKRLVHLSKLH
jgi:hypothetical protein